MSIPIDSDECADLNGGCEVNCENLPGSYQCSCDNGWLLEADGHSCSGMGIVCKISFYVILFCLRMP